MAEDRDERNSADDEDEDILDISLDDLPEEKHETEDGQSGGVLEITLDDLDGTDDAAGQYPGVDPAALKAGTQAADEIQMYCLCTETGQPFHIYWQEISPGIFGVSRVDTAAEKGVGGGADPGAIQGQFSLTDFPGCPWCGCRAMSVCEGCGITICEAAVQTTWTGKRTLKCPNCGQRGDVADNAGTAYGTRGGKGKGKKG